LDAFPNTKKKKKNKQKLMWLQLLPNPAITMKLADWCILLTIIITINAGQYSE